MSATFKMAWRNMWRNWRRTVIAMVAIVLGVVLLLFFDGLLQGSDQAVFGNAVRLYGGNIQIHAPGYRDKANRLPLLPIQNADTVVQAALNGPEVVAAGLLPANSQWPVVGAAKRINTGGMVSSREGSYPVMVTGIQPSLEERRSIQAENIVAGRFLMDGEGDALLIGKGLADLLKVNVGDRVTLLGHSKHETMRQRTVTVVGIYDLGMPDAEKGTVFVTLSEAQSLYNLRDQVTEVTVSLRRVGQEKQVISQLQSALPGYEVDSWDTIRPEFRETLNTKMAFTSIFGLMLVFIASIGILNIQLMAVFERTREMGVLAALGMKGRQLMNLFLLEGALIGGVGALIGCILGGALIAGLAQVGIDFSFTSGMGDIVALMGDRLYPSITLTDIIGRGITVTIIAAIASLYPAWQASRKEPAEALHHV